MIVAVILLAAAVAPDLRVTKLAPAPGRLVAQVTLRGEAPAEWTEALSGGAKVSVIYRFRLYRSRNWLWDQRMGAHELVVKAERDPLTGTFALTAEYDGEILASGQAGSLEETLRRMLSPLPVDMSVPLKHEPLLLFVRAEFMTRYTLLVIPRAVGTDWVQITVPEAP